MVNHPNRSKATDVSLAKAAEIAAALERVAKDLRRITDMLPDGFGDARTPQFWKPIGCLSAQAKSWSDVMWDIANQKKRNAA